MKTDDLIEALARRADPVQPGLASRRLVAASLLGAAAAAPLMAVLLGLNPDLGADARTPMFWAKVLFVASVAVLAWRVVRQLARPGTDARPALQLLGAPFVAMVALAVVELMRAPAGERLSRVLGVSWDVCPLYIATLSIPALALLFAVVHSLAPTNPRQAGAATGLLAGALGALAYLLHCPEMAAPFLAVWYVLGMLIPAVVGWVLARRLLAW